MVADAFFAVHRRVLPEQPLNPWSRSALDGYPKILIKVADGIRRAGAFDEPQPGPLQAFPRAAVEPVAFVDRSAQPGLLFSTTPRQAGLSRRIR